LPPPGTIADDDILVAGCGTGQESLDLARQFPRSRMLAVDLSGASLAYAQRKTREAGIANVEYAQADIVELAGLERRFDVIWSVGVLHHLSDPEAGWRALVALLKPGGFMQVGLYSALARRDITEARAFIQQRGHAPDATGIRRARAEILASPLAERVGTLRDFYGLHECRDLLFHEQEHCLSLPQIESMLARLALEFIGMAVSREVAAGFAQRFPGRESALALANWHAFETAFPDTFAGMYVFWVRKRA
jgi:2-polyprenyl-3-methyl-5-hydroxy-6-metoxy-1,4-benzoquinol methylase